MGLWLRFGLGLGFDCVWFMVFDWFGCLSLGLMFGSMCLGLDRFGGFEVGLVWVWVGLGWVGFGWFVFMF